jgi:hypothetical protein
MLYQPTPQYHSPAIIFQESQRQNYNIVLDLRRAYRQLVIDPGDIHLMGYKWKGHIYFDRVLTMGLRSAASMTN